MKSRKHLMLPAAGGLVILLIIIVAVFAFFMSRGGTKSQSKLTPSPIASSILLPTPSPTPLFETKLYQNTYQKYSINIPSDWEVEEVKNIEKNSDSKVMFTPKDKKYGTASKFEIITKPSGSANLTSEADFQTWLTKKPDAAELEGQTLYKLDDLVIDGVKGVTIIDVGTEQQRQKGFYNLVTWIRRNEINYYFNYTGDQKITESDFRINQELVKSFKFHL